MFETLMHTYHELPGTVRFVVDFFFSVVFLRGIVANEINKEVRAYWKLARKKLQAFATSERTQALWDQYGNGQAKSTQL